MTDAPATRGARSEPHGLAEEAKSRKSLKNLFRLWRRRGGETDLRDAIEELIEESEEGEAGEAALDTSESDLLLNVLKFGELTAYDVMVPRADIKAVADDVDLRGLIQTVREFGHLDILVNNAAFQQHQPSLDELDDEQLQRTFTTNILAYFRVTKAALRHLKKGSVIINTGSITGLEGSAELLDYSATKGAIHAFTKSLAQNLVEKGIRVNCVAPGPIWTPLNPSDRDAEDVAKFGADQPMKRPGQPEEVAPAFVFFASNADSSYITGEVLTLLGGETTAG